MYKRNIRYSLLCVNLHVEPAIVTLTMNNKYIMAISRMGNVGSSSTPSPLSISYIVDNNDNTTG